uniref:Uncharacterized protein n=1 Tax=Oryza sativa subsp. japonica TaxID=39947 RepID=Q5Z497_ORYSJ|nr:hypothetical protein [Oryza sativa Japonica Group]
MADRTVGDGRAARPSQRAHKAGGGGGRDQSDGGTRAGRPPVAAARRAKAREAAGQGEKEGREEECSPRAATRGGERRGSSASALPGTKAERRPDGVPRTGTGGRRLEGPGEDGGEVRRGREGSQRHESLVGAAAEVLLGAAKRAAATARLGVARSGAKRWLESAAAVEGGSARGDGASEAGRGNGADAGVRHDAAKPLVAVARNGGGGSGCGDRLEGRRRAAAGGATVAGWFSCTGGLRREGKREREVRGMFL